MILDDASSRHLRTPFLPYGATLGNVTNTSECEVGNARARVHVRNAWESVLSRIIMHMHIIPRVGSDEMGGGYSRNSLRAENPKADHGLALRFLAPLWARLSPRHVSGLA